MASWCWAKPSPKPGTISTISSAPVKCSDWLKPPAGPCRSSIRKWRSARMRRCAPVDAPARMPTWPASNASSTSPSRTTPADCAVDSSPSLQGTSMSYHWNWGILLEPVSTGEPSTYLGWLLSGLFNTVAVSLAAWIIALAVGACMGILRTLPDRRLAAIGTAYVVVFRNIPLIVQFFIWYIVLPELLPKALGDWFKSLAPLMQFYSTSVLCLGLFTAARVCEQVRSGLNALPRGQKAAGLALGLTLAQVYRFILLPVGWRIIVPPITSEFLNIFKNSAVASTIGLLELSAQARQLVDFTAQPYESFIAVTLAYGLINLSVMYLMRWLEHKTSLPGYLGAK